MGATKSALNSKNKEFIKENCLKLTAKELAEHTNVSIGTIRGFIYREGLEYKLGKTGASKRLSQEEIDYIQANQETKTHPQMAEDLGISRKRVSYVCSKYKLTKTKSVAEKSARLKPLPKFLVVKPKIIAERKEPKYVKPKGIKKGSRLDTIHQPIKKYNSLF